MHAVSGPGYEDTDDMITEDVPAHPGTDIYAITKGCGHLLSQVLVGWRDADQTGGVHILNALFHAFFNANLPHRNKVAGGDTAPMSISWGDAGRLLRRCLEVDLSRLPTRCEVFWGSANTPHGRYSNSKTRHMLQWTAQDSLSVYWTRPGFAAEDDERNAERSNKAPRRD